MSNPSDSRFIYLATPWGQVGGGMYKVAEYLVQAQDDPRVRAKGHTELIGLDTRGNGSALSSMAVLAQALWHILQGRMSGRLAGVHVNIAERLSLFRKGVVVAACRLLNIPVVLHLHAAQLPSSYARLPAPARAMVRWVFSLASTCIVLGNSARQFVIDTLRLPPEKVEVIINGVPEPALPRRRVTPGRRQRVLFLGNLTERKGVTDLLHSLRHSGFAGMDFEASFAGGGAVEAYKEKARELGLDQRVRFEGWADAMMAARLISDADVLILPSYDEGLPLVILEALGNGVAVICTPVGEIPMVLEDGKDALFVKPGDVEGIALALQRVLRDAEFRQTLEKNGRASYEARFSVARFFDNVARIHRRDFGTCAAGKHAARKREAAA